MTMDIAKLHTILNTFLIDDEKELTLEEKVNKAYDKVMLSMSLVPKKDNLETIGDGSFAIVYKEHNNIDDQEYAIKKININIDDYTLPKDILWEARILAKMSYHPNIVRYYHSWLDTDRGLLTDEDEEGSGIYLNLQLELCDFTLRDYMCTEIYNDDDVKRLKLWYGIILALQHLHKYSVIHRDIKPSNLFIKNNIIKLGDFGMSRIYPYKDTKKSIEVGTAYYRAPEIDTGIYDESVDIYSAGIIMIELLLRYNTMMEKDKIIRNMFRYRTLPQLMNNNYNMLIERMISHEPSTRPKSIEIKL